MKSLLFFLLTLYTSVTPAGGDIGSQLIGNWLCVSGPCFDEEMSFSFEGDEQIFSSWLHQRPSAVNGNWKLNGNDITVECCAGLVYEWSIVKLTETELVLHERDSNEDIIFRRIGD